MYNRHLIIRDNLITECGESALALVGKSMLTREKSYDCLYCGHHHPWGFDEPTDEYSRECIIANNKIHDIGLYGKQTAGLFMAIYLKRNR